MISAVMPTYGRYDLTFDHGEGVSLLGYRTDVSSTSVPGSQLLALDTATRILWKLFVSRLASLCTRPTSITFRVRSVWLSGWLQTLLPTACSSIILAVKL